MYLVSAEQMRAIDRHTIEEIGIPGPVLMENAGRAIAQAIRDRWPVDKKQAKPWLVLVGKGNNGGDGVVAARQLIEAGIPAELVYAVDPQSLSGDAALQRDIAAKLRIPSMVYTAQPGRIQWQQYAGVIDGLLGTGTSGPPKEPYASLIREANASGLPIVAIDLPSGMHADTGEVFDPCIRATLTVSLGFLKIGLTQYPAAELAGETIVQPIGIPSFLAEQWPVRTKLTDEAVIRDLIGGPWPPARSPNAHKGTYGHVLVAASSRTYSGAGWLTAKAALRAGSGLVTWALPDTLIRSLAGHLPEAILTGVPDDGQGNWAADSADTIVHMANERSVLAIGPGIGRFAEEREWLRTIWEQTRVPMVADADALNILAEANGLEQWKRPSVPVVLTPHPGEMARLTGMSTRDVQRDRVGLARSFATTHEVTLVLKGARTVIATPNGDVFVNATGNPGMATAGSGDVLTGIIAGLIAQGFPSDQAAVLGVYWHGLAGDRVAQTRTMASIISSDLIEAL